jgi:hypothetical protein
LRNNQKSRIFTLTLIGLATVTIWQFPFGHQILYPFTLLATWFHEMSHGLAAMLSGGHLEKLEIFADGSGVAHNAIADSRFIKALVAAAGPLGPAIFGSIILISSRKVGTARLTLTILGILMVVSAVFWVRTVVGIGLVSGAAALILISAMAGSNKVLLFVTQLVGLQALISAFQRTDYLFVGSGEAGGKLSVSDTELIAQNLFLPFWFWGVLLLLTILFMSWQSFKFTFSK